jgi:hypothetical protein
VEATSISARVTSQPEIGVPLVLACAALVTELRAVLAASGVDDRVELDLLPAPLHNTPDRIVAAIEARLAEVDRSRPVVLGYADCGTGGGLDAFIARSGRPITRLPGAHCYEFFAGGAHFAALHDAEPGTFYLTDFLAKHFDALVWHGMGLDRHPTMRHFLFGNYRRVVLLAQSGDPSVVERGRTAADRLGLDFELVTTGLAPFETSVSVALAEVAR